MDKEENGGSRTGSEKKGADIDLSSPPCLSESLPSTSKTKMDKRSIKSRFEDPTLDPTWLYNTLRKEITRESSYDLENDAKIRAVTQGTVDYEQFRQMVLGAHICPLQRKDKVEGCQNGKKPYVVWNTMANKGSQKPTKVTETDLPDEVRSKRHDTDSSDTNFCIKSK